MNCLVTPAFWIIDSNVILNNKVHMEPCFLFWMYIQSDPADSLVDSVDGWALHHFQVLRVRARRPTAVWYTLENGVFAVASLREKLPVYIVVWQIKSVNNNTNWNRNSWVLPTCWILDNNAIHRNK